jgi:ABC-type dipeptide/oligopeptide/nickel transport system permease component
MTANWAGTLVIVLIVAFFVVVALGIAMGVYAASNLKKCEDEKKTAV